MFKCSFKCHSWAREINNIASVESTRTLYGRRPRDLVFLLLPLAFGSGILKSQTRSGDANIKAARTISEDARCLAKSCLVAMVTRSNSQYRKDTSTSRGGSHAPEAAINLRLSRALPQPLRVGDRVRIGVTATGMSGASLNELWRSETVGIDRD